MSDKPQQLEPSQNGKDGKGRFSKGNKFGKGNPYAEYTNACRSKWVERVSVKELGPIIDRLVRSAQAGDMDAIKVVLERCLGKAVQALELTGQDGENVTFTFNIKTAGNE